MFIKTRILKDVTDAEIIVLIMRTTIKTRITEKDVTDTGIVSIVND
jgi:hypothetical protein